jgi:hypothetical protein
LEDPQHAHHPHNVTDWVTLRHPLTGDVQEVEATPESLTPLMIQGYQKFMPANPAKEE